MKNSYNVYGKQQTVSAKSENAIVPNDNLQLSWSHYLFLMRIDNPDERNSMKSKQLTTINMHWVCFKMAYKILKRNKDIEYIIFWQQLIGIYFGFLSRLLMKRHNAKTILLTFIFNQKKGFLGKLHKKLFLFSIQSVNISNQFN